MFSSLGVLITYYGERELLGECVQSILAGDAAPDEILVYDDASAQPAEAYVPPGAPVRIIRASENRGPAHGRNVLLNTALSTYVHFHDADDLVHPDWAREVRAVVQRSAPDVILTDIAAVRDGQVVSGRVMELDTLPAGADLVQFALRGALLLPSSTFRRELGLHVGGFRTRATLPQSEDFDFHVRLVAAATSWEAIPRSLVIQRLRRGSHSSNQVEVWDSAATAVELLSEELPARYHDELSETAARVGSRLFELSARSEARRAFRLARRLGRPTYAHRRGTYAVVARTVGPEAGEWAGLLLRALRRAVGTDAQAST